MLNTNFYDDFVLLTSSCVHYNHKLMNANVALMVPCSCLALHERIQRHLEGTHRSGNSTYLRLPRNED